MTNVAAPQKTWRRLASIVDSGEWARSLAHSASGEIAVGDDAGVTWWQGEARERAVLSSVQDLAFDAEGVLWIATSKGLFSWHRDSRPERRRLAGGEAANRIERLAISGSTLLLATGAGAIWSANGRVFQRLDGSSAAVGISHVAIRLPESKRFDPVNPHSRMGLAEAWMFGAGRLLVVKGLEAASGMRVTRTQGLTLPTLVSDRALVDLIIDPAGRRVHLVFGDSIAWRSIDAGAADSSRMGWTIERPILPPGASIRRLGWADGRVWIATDHGLMVAESLSGLFRRAASPVGTTRCDALQSNLRDQAIVLCRTGVFALVPALTEMLGKRIGKELNLLDDPPLAEIRRRALRRSGLTVGRTSEMWQGLRRRAFLPEVALRFDLDFDVDRNWDSDQAFISGERRQLFDRTRDEDRSYGASIVLDWDLGGLVYPTRTVDLSRELRQLVSLRDDVADEINQLYFERQAIRESLSARDPIEAREALRLRWRAREIDAGLDAWTGGWISRWRAADTLPNPVSHPNDHQPIPLNWKDKQ